MPRASLPPPTSLAHPAAASGPRARAYQTCFGRHCPTTALAETVRLAPRQDLARGRRKKAFFLGKQRAPVPAGAFTRLDQAKGSNHDGMTVRWRAATEKMHPCDRSHLGDQRMETVAALCRSNVSRNGPGMCGQRHQASRPAPSDELQPSLLLYRSGHRHAPFAINAAQTFHLTANTFTRKACVYLVSSASGSEKPGAPAR